jgi:hypothetical protein
MLLHGTSPPGLDHDEKATFSHRPEHVNYQESSHGQATTDSNPQPPDP